MSFVHKVRDAKLTSREEASRGLLDKKFVRVRENIFHQKEKKMEGQISCKLYIK